MRLWDKHEWLERYGISPRDAAVCALLSVGAAMALGVRVNAVAAMFSGVLGFGMLVITITDSRRMLIPDVISFPLFPIGLIASIACLPGEWTAILTNHVIAAAAAAGALYGLRWVYFKLRGVIGLGLGDVKIAAVAGAWLGLEPLPMTLLLASCAALIATLVRGRLKVGPHLSTSTAVPFGSFIAPAILIGWILLLIGACPFVRTTYKLSGGSMIYERHGEDDKGVTKPKVAGMELCIRCGLKQRGRKPHAYWNSFVRLDKVL